ncbi:U-box domain-containing protein 9 [Malania oleifera]|uniref:U-box domain-containing protein 9 n=1 Tax=Malania oleifera TaxID=397392 RepID=UPI0025AE6425|nr:U-box domain-containing protein 9 [Malania oleifera]
MAKSGVLETGPTAAAAAKATELKKELLRVVMEIVEDDECGIGKIDEARETLRALKDLKLKRTPSLKLEESLAFPEAFRCPLSKELMRDPVILATGQTYDRPCIQRWLKSGNHTCPHTHQVLSHTILTPNHLIREMIAEWCKSHGMKLPDHVQFASDGGGTEIERDHFLSLLGKMSSSLPEKKEAAKELRLLTKRMPSFRALFSESVSTIPQLLSPLAQSKSESQVHYDLQEDLVTTLLNISIHDNNKKLVAETPMAIPSLIDALKFGTIQTRTNAAAAFFTLSALDSNKELIGKSGALKPLIDLLEEGHLLAMKDVAAAIFNLCILHENKARAVKGGAVRVILQKIMSNVQVDELLAILAMLSGNHRAVEEMGELGAVPCLLGIVRESTCGRNKENCIAILYTVCFNDRTRLKEIREEEKTYGTISQLGQNGTSRAKRKANAILERLNRTVNITHTA